MNVHVSFVGGGGGGGLLPPRLGGFFRGGLAVGSLACWTLSGRERRRPSRIACDISFENDFISSSSKSDSLVHVRDCTSSWVKELPGGVADDVIFPRWVVGPSERGLLPVQVSNLVMAAVMASLLLSFWYRVVSFDPCPFGFDESDIWSTNLGCASVGNPDIRPSPQTILLLTRLISRGSWLFRADFGRSEFTFSR